MKVRAVVSCDGEETIYTIPCGTGDNTMRWLALACSQRYAEDVSMQLRPSDIFLNGRSMDANATIKNSLADGDEVKVVLQYKVAVDRYGNPIDSEWAKRAFYQQGENDQHKEIDETAIATESEEAMRSKIEFIRTTMNQQMLNWKKIGHAVNVLWPEVERTFPRLTAQHSLLLKEICTKEFLVLEEMFRRYAKDGYIFLADVEELLLEAEIFKKEHIPSVAKQAFHQIAKLLPTDAVGLGLSGYIALLLLVSQVRFNVSG